MRKLHAVYFVTRLPVMLSMMHMLRRIESSVARAPCVLLATWLVSASVLASLPLWPISEDGTRLFSVSSLFLDPAGDPSDWRQSAMMHRVDNSRMWWNLRPDLECNGLGLLFGLLTSMAIPRMLWKEESDAFPARAALAGILLGILMSGVLSLACRILLLVVGEMNMAVPAGLFFVILCPLASRESIKAWRRRTREEICSECGYLLWGLPEKRCPECGAEFG